MAEDQTIRGRINELAEEERDLRERLSQGKIEPSAEHIRLAEIEVELDQCWDLLRQRAAKREFAQDPDSAAVRSPDVVERYLS